LFAGIDAILQKAEKIGYISRCKVAAHSNCAQQRRYAKSEPSAVMRVTQEPDSGRPKRAPVEG
jgi:hypothetical protein